MTHNHLYMPGQVAVGTVQEIERRRNPENQSGIGFPIARVASYLNKLEPGDLAVICGLPSNGKSLLGRFWLRDAVTRNNEADRMGVFVSYEQSKEQQGMIDLSELSGVSTTAMFRGQVTDADMDKIRAASIQRGKIPSAFVGHSTTIKMGRGRPMPTMQQVDDALYRLVTEQEKRPLMVAIDYLQRIPIEARENPTLAYSANVDYAKDLAIKYACPVLLLTQAKPEVRERKWKMPRMGDSQWTSNAEQSADVFIGVMMPKTSEAIGDELPKAYTGGQVVAVTESLFVFGLDKQKYGVAPRTSFLKADPAHGTLADFEQLPEPAYDWHK